MNENEWRQWLDQAEESLKGEYLGRPQRLISDYQKEREIRHGYQGREILELIQNGADAAEKGRVAGCVHIELSPQGLIVANKGDGFDTDGIESLQMANFSPKRKALRKGGAMIGNKGLGFRSILNWTTTPLIDSGSLRLAYSPEKSRRVLEELKSKSSVLSDLVDEEAIRPGTCVVPLLAFPEFVTCWSSNIPGDDPAVRAIAERFGTLRGKGFDSVIGMPFGREDAYDHALRQLRELRPEILLFVRSIESLVIDIAGEVPRRWLKEPSAFDTTILENGVPLGKWQVFESFGEVPSALRDADEELLRYQVSVAVPRHARRAPTPLFCFFPTEVQVPLPVVCHATLKLEENRKHPIQGKVNDYILQRLAEQVADAAEVTLDDPRNTPWSACDLITARGPLPMELDRAGFAEVLRNAVRNRSIVPTLAGDFVTVAEAKLVKGTSTAWLPGEHFPEMAWMEDESHRPMFLAMGLEEMSEEEVARRLASAEELSAEGRALAIAGMVVNRFTSAVCSSGLLCDAEGKLIPAGVRVFLNSAATLPDPPQWAKLCFMLPELREELGQILDLREARELQAALKQFRVVDYSMQTLISGVVAEANRLVQASSELEARYRMEVLDFLWSLFSTFATEMPPLFPEEVSLKIPDQVGLFRPSKELYMGRGYGTSGAIVQELYGAWAPEKLAQEPSELCPGCDDGRYADFLAWLGVARWPREQPLAAIPSDFVGHVMKSIQFPARFGNHVIISEDSLYDPGVSGVQTVDSIDRILCQEPAAVLSWLAYDERAEGWSRPSKQHGQATERIYSGSNRHRWDGPVPSFIHWVLSRSEWLPVSKGGRARPAECLRGEHVIEVLFPRPHTPPVHLLEQFGLNSQALLESAFRRAGVLGGLSYLERDAIYDLLLQMPSRSPDGSTARALYQWLLDNDSGFFGSGDKNFRKFMAEGQMWGRVAGISGYFPVSDLRYLDRDGLPASLVEKLPLVQLPKRAGSRKVHKLFGVKSMDREDLRQGIASFRLSPDWQLCADQFRSAKPFLKKLRSAQSSNAQHLGRLEKLELLVCDELRITVTYEGFPHEHDVGAWDYVIVEESLYIRCDGKGEMSWDLLGDSVGAALASFFEVSGGDSYTKLFLCKNSDRGELLKRMGGEELVVDFEEILAVVAGPSWAGPIDPPTPAVPRGNSPDEEATLNGVADNVGGSGTEESSGACPTSTVSRPSVTEVEHFPSAPPTPRKISIRRKGVTPSGPRAPRSVTDGDLCERMALEFEVSDDPPRCPLPVGHMTGYEAYGCDILSFDNEEHLKAFQDSSTRDLSKVRRFIEVKGRSNATAKIELAGNELEAARSLRERYYLYRFFEETDGSFSVTILSDPLGERGATTTAIHVDLDRAISSKRYSLEFLEEAHGHANRDAGDTVRAYSVLPRSESAE